MINTGLFSHIAMVVLAISIGYFYIAPTFADVASTQDDIALYQIEREKIDQVNQQLRDLVTTLESVPAEDQTKLLTYIPDNVDTIAVSRVLQRIALNNSLLVGDIAYNEVSASLNEDRFEVERQAIPHEFQLSVEGSYQQIKSMLADLERNEYPLEVHQLEITPVEGNLLQASMLIMTYSHIYPEESAFINL